MHAPEQMRASISAATFGTGAGTGAAAAERDTTGENKYCMPNIIERLSVLLTADDD